MSKIKALRQQKADVVKEAKELNAKDAMSEAEESRFNDLMTQAEQIEAAILREEKLQDLERSMGVIQDINDDTPEESQSRSGNPKKGFASFGEQLQAVVKAAKNPHAIDPRLIVSAGATGMSEGVGSDGGFLVQKDYSGELLAMAKDTGILAREVKRVPIGPNSNGIRINAVNETSRANGSRWGGVLAYWLSEAEAGTAKKPKFRQMDMTLQKLVGLVYLTDELLADAVALEAVVKQAFAEEFGFQFDDKIFNGTGSGVPLGILNSDALVTVSKEVGQSAATIVAENLEKMYTRMPARSLSRAKWYLNQECWPQLFQLQHVVGATGVPVYLPPNGLADAPFGTLLGRPIQPIEHASALGTVGDIVLADFSEYLWIEKDGIQSASSIHVKFAEDETALRFVARANGQPIPNSPLTPYKGTATLSPFVALETRS